MTFLLTGIVTVALSFVLQKVNGQAECTLCDLYAKIDTIVEKLESLEQTVSKNQEDAISRVDQLLQKVEKLESSSKKVDDIFEKVKKIDELNSKVNGMVTTIGTIDASSSQIDTLVDQSNITSSNVGVLLEKVGIVQQSLQNVDFISKKINTFEGSTNAIQTAQTNLSVSLQELKTTQSKLVDRFTAKNSKDCADVFKAGNRKSGVYTIYPTDTCGFIRVFCDMTTDGGGWTVFQRRQDGSVDFYRGWNDYKYGFGKLDGEFWLGNDIIHRLTNFDQYELRVDLEDTSGTSVYALYNNFKISSEYTNYKLTVGAYSGNAGNSMSTNGHPFSTKDRDNDNNSASCAQAYKGAWWYGNCHSSNLNGLYHKGAHKSYADGVNWYAFKGHYYSLKTTSMKIRPVGFRN